MAVGGQLLAYALHHFFQCGITVGRHLLHDFGAVFLSQPNFILLGHQYEIAVSGHRIGGAGRQQ